MQKIKKVIFDDDTELELEGLKPISDFKSSYGYRNQFRDFEDDLLEYIDDDRIEHYAEFSLDMVKEDDCECEEKTIDEFTDKIVIREAFYRINANWNSDIVSDDLLTRFIHILSVGDKLDLESYIAKKEIELKL